MKAMRVRLAQVQTFNGCRRLAALLASRLILLRRMCCMRRCCSMAVVQAALAHLACRLMNQPAAQPLEATPIALEA